MIEEVYDIIIQLSIVFDIIIKGIMMDTAANFVCHCEYQSPSD